jgi:hypothetical protein
MGSSYSFSLGMGSTWARTVSAGGTTISESTEAVYATNVLGITHGCFSSLGTQYAVAPTASLAFDRVR